MQTVALVVLLLVALALIGVVLLQRSEGGGLGMGTGGVMTGRGQASALARATWWLGGAFMAVSVALTILAAERAGTGSVVDQIDGGAGGDAQAPTDLGGGSLLPPPAAEAPLVPLDGAAPADATGTAAPAATAPATEAPLVPAAPAPADPAPADPGPAVDPGPATTAPTPATGGAATGSGG